jgi:hypothetical protein
MEVPSREILRGRSISEARATGRIEGERAARPRPWRVQVRRGRCAETAKAAPTRITGVPPIGLRWGRSRKLRDGIVKRQDHPGPEGRVDAEKLSSTAAWDGPITEAVVPE